MNDRKGGEMLSDEDYRLGLLYARELERERCQADLYYLAREVLGYRELNERIHHPLCDIVQSVNAVVRALRDKKPLPDTLELRRGGSLGAWLSWDERSRERLFNMFRGSFKTTLISIAHTIQLMLIWPDIRILIASHKKEGGSGEILYAIKRHFIGNHRFRELFPEYCPKENTVGQIEWGTSERVTLVNRSPDCAWPEATIEIAGSTTDVTGRHYDYIKNDDLVTRDSVTNETMLSKTREFKALQKFLFNQPEWGITDNVGTPYHFNDLYNNLRKSRGITKVIIPAIDDENRPTFPERFTIEGLMAIRNDPTMGSYEFSCQYQMNPVPPEDQCFRPEWLEGDGFFYDKPPDNLNIYVFVDPAASRRKKSDYTALISIGVDSKGTFYLLDIIRDKLNPEGRTNLALRIAQKHKINRVFYETVGFQDTDKFIIKRKSREINYPLTIVETKAAGSSKEDRIRGLQPIYERADIRWPHEYIYHSEYDRKRHNMVEELRDEMLMFPKCEHDDLLDAHSQLLQVSALKPSNESKPKRDQTEWDWVVKHTKDYYQKPRPRKFGKRSKWFEIPFRESFR